MLLDGRNKLVLANVEDGVNRAIYTAQESLDVIGTSPGPAADQWRSLLDEGDRIKTVSPDKIRRVQHSLQLITTYGQLDGNTVGNVADVILGRVHAAGVVDAFVANGRTAVDQQLARILPANSVLVSDELRAQLALIAERKTASASIAPALDELRRAVTREARAVHAATFCSLIDRLAQEFCVEVATAHAAQGATNAKLRSISQNSLNNNSVPSPTNVTSASTSSPTHQSLTPKSRRKMRFFDKSTAVSSMSRPKSIVNGNADAQHSHMCSSLDTSEIMTSSDEGASLGVVNGSAMAESTSVNSNLNGSADLPDVTIVNDNLIAAQKSRARLGAQLAEKRRARSRPVRSAERPAIAEESEFKVAEFFDKSINQTIKPSSTENGEAVKQPLLAEQPKKETSKT